MSTRILLFVAALFWVTMNVLLWRSEFGSKNIMAGDVPVEVVWHKILTAPDDSALEVRHRGKKIGFCQWVANVGQEEATGKTFSEDLVPDGLVVQPTGYRIDFNGTVGLGDLPQRLRIDLNLRFATNHAWQELRLRLSMRPSVWDFRASAAEETLRLKIEDSAGEREEVFRFAELQNPQALMQRFGGPLPIGLLTAAGLPIQPRDITASALGLKWEAQNDWLQVGHSKVRVYRLRARLFDRFEVTVLVSRVGEILRVDLPDELVLINDELTGFNFRP